jgi:hypothetical protein
LGAGFLVPATGVLPDACLGFILGSAETAAEEQSEKSKPTTKTTKTAF